MAQRKLDDWISTYTKYVQGMDVPEIFAKWSGISAVSAALERRVWIKTPRKGALYPNLYVFLIGRPGIGKSIPINQCREMVSCIKDKGGNKSHFICAPSVTSAAIIDELADAKRTYTDAKGAPVEYNSLAAIINELGVFMYKYDIEFTSLLTDLWDGYYYRSRRRGGPDKKGINLEIARPSISLLAGMAPRFIGDTMPEGAWDHGFMARVMMIYSEEMPDEDLFTAIETNDDMRKNLKHDINIIGNLTGEFGFSPEFVEAWRAWKAAGCVPVPEHPRLYNYNVRRIPQLLKLCTIAAVSRGAPHIISAEDLSTALEWIIEAETWMPEVFSSMGGARDAQIITECLHFIKTQQRITNLPVPESAVISFIRDRAANVTHVMPLLETMVQSREVKRTLKARVGNVLTIVE